MACETGSSVFIQSREKTSLYPSNDTLWEILPGVQSRSTEIYDVKGEKKLIYL